MAGRITGAVAYGKSLAFLTESSIVLVHNNGREPNEWPQEIFSSVGTNDEFVWQFAELMEYVGATRFPEAQKGEIKGAIVVVLVEGLLPAYEHLRLIRAFKGDQIPLLNRRQHFEEFTSALWRAYKTLTPKATKLLGFDIGFLFQDPGKFESGAKAFNSAHPDRAFVVDYFRAQRTNWQDELKDFRNQFIEHRGTERDGFTKFYEPETAESLFNVVWKTIAYILPAFIAANFAGPFGIQEIPLDERNRENPRRFRWVGPSGT
jgi:hypothetical protein